MQDGEIFSQVVRLIASSRESAVRTVNTALIDLYWNIGETISRKIEASEWGDGVVEELARSSPRLTQVCVGLPGPIRFG